MIKRVVIISPEFTKEKILHVPWRQMFELASRLNKRGIETAILTSQYFDTKIDNVTILNLNQKKIHELTNDSKKKIDSFSPDLIYWMGNSYSGQYINSKSFDIPIIVHISTVHMLWNELKFLSISEVLKNYRLQLLTSFYPFRKIVSKLNNNSIVSIISSTKTISQRLVQLGVNHSKIITSPLFFEPSFIPKESNFKKSFTICYAGPYDSVRGSQIILNAIEILKRKNINVKLLFLLRSYNLPKEKLLLDKLCKKKGISNCVKIVAGILTPSQVFDYINSCGANY